MMTAPKITDDKMYMLLRGGEIEQFNQLKAKGAVIHFEGLDFRGLDLRGMDASGISFESACFRQADLRGIDLSSCCLEGCSICSAKISGVIFPTRLSAEEITLSLVHGTRMRYR